MLLRKPIWFKPHAMKFEPQLPIIRGEHRVVSSLDARRPR